MERRSRRRRVNNNVSSSLYVGYVEDEETIESIMKKFEEVERLKKEIAEKKEKEKENQDAAKASNDEKASNSNNEETTFTEEQYEELFKRTASFTPKSLDADIAHMEDWEFLADPIIDDDLEENDYELIDEDFGWDEETTPTTTTRKHKRARSEKRHTDKQSLLNKYKVMQMQMQDRNGNYFMVRRKIAEVDPSLPTYIRIPQLPVSRYWSKSIRPLSESMEIQEGFRYFEENIFNFDFSKIGHDFQAIYMDPPFVLPGEEKAPGQITIQEFEQLKIANLVEQGFLFIWCEKELIPELLRICESWSFKYVENFTWIKKYVNNRIVRQPYTYFNKSKITCFIFRKEGDIELRHQRSPDCEFDFIKPKLPNELVEQKPEFMYKVIETLLPQARYSPTNNKGTRLLELFSRKNSKRKGWTSIVQDWSK